MHTEQKLLWEASHKRSKSNTSALDLVKKVKDAFTGFPSFVIQVKMKYFDLYHDDRWGHPMPWFMATLQYKRPSDRSYGLFDHIPTAPFSTDPQQGSPTLVHMLLSPPPTFNQHVKLDKEKGSILAAFAAGSGIGASIAKLNKHSTLGRLIDVGQLIYSFANIFELKFSIADFWLKGTDCFIRTRLVVTSAIDGMSLCQYIASKGSEGLYALYKSEKSSSVRVSVVGVDFFNKPRPHMTAIVTEGLLIAGVNDTPVTIEVSNDPAVIPHYVGTVRMAKKVRWTVAITNFLLFVLKCVQVALDARSEYQRLNHK
ncbi:dense granule protein gra12 [Cystoisospora suis]|uniref:Dense granule protein gra12 n=1 Tax=Cystoisospora suis TaxID=483139 RepID=A0A2C6LCP3_9APIC|nr:dense granule protein gra12 [Cystoisospora suis]